MTTSAIAEIETVGVTGVDLSGPAIERIEAYLLKGEQPDCPLRHTFAPGVYMREILMPAGWFIIGHQHKTEHVNIVLSGEASVVMDGVVHRIKGPCSFVSRPGVRKVLLIHSDMRWITVHPTAETDLAKLEDELIEKSAAYLAHERERDAKLLTGGSR